MNHGVIRATRRAGCLLAFAATGLLTHSCQLGPVDWNTFDQRSVEQDLAALDSAGTVYGQFMNEGHLDSAVVAAVRILLQRPGTDTAGISPDSTVWVVYANGLVAATGEPEPPPSVAALPAPLPEPDVRPCDGGEVGDWSYLVAPFDQEMPASRAAVEAIKKTFSDQLRWTKGEQYYGASVTIDLARSLFATGARVIYWIGHGGLMPAARGKYLVPGILTGTPYATKSMADAAIGADLGYLKPGSGSALAGVWRRPRDGKFYVVILPAFVQAFGSFDQLEDQPYNNYTKTLVYISCCGSGAEDARSPGSGLLPAFQSAGADVVCGWDWATHDAFACEKDTTFFNAMSDTCLPLEAQTRMGNLTDPTPYRGRNATFVMAGDEKVMLRAVLQAKKRGTLYRSLAAAAHIGHVTGATGSLVTEGETKSKNTFTFEFPGQSPGDYDVTTVDGAVMMWVDATSGRTYLAQKGFVGISGSIHINRCESDIVSGSFDGRLGYWAPPNDPNRDQPTEIIDVADGCVKCTGKITQTGLSAGTGNSGPEVEAATNRGP